MDAPNVALQRRHTSAHRLLGMWDTFVMGSIFSGLPMLTCRPTEQDRAAEVIRQEHGQEKPQAVCLPHDSPTRGSQGARSPSTGKIPLDRGEFHTWGEGQGFF